MSNFCSGLAAGLALASVPLLAAPKDVVLPDWTVGKDGVAICEGVRIRESIKAISCLP